MARHRGFTDSFETAAALAEAIEAIPGLDRARLLVFGGWESASRGAGVHAADGRANGWASPSSSRASIELTAAATMASFEILERIEGGKHQVSVCAAPPAVLGWATGYLPEPRNNPQVGMANMRTVMPALQRAKATPLPSDGLSFHRSPCPDSSARRAW